MKLPWVQKDDRTKEALTMFGRVSIMSHCYSPFFHVVFKRQLVLGWKVFHNGQCKGWFESLGHAERCAEGVVESNALMVFRRNKP